MRRSLLRVKSEERQKNNGVQSPPRPQNTKKLPGKN
jgi:hypothetical protein